MACGLHDKRNELIDWKVAYRLFLNVLQHQNFAFFKFKLFQRRLATNSFFKKRYLDLNDNDLCNFCPSEEETPIYFFGTLR